MSDGGRRWFERSKGFVARVKSADAAPGEDDTPDLWTRCPGCAATLFNETLAEHDQVCPQCGHHFPLDGPSRVAVLCDEGSLEVHDLDLTSVDTLGFVDSKPYDRRIAAAMAKTGRNDAFVAASATIHGIPVEIGSMDFQFLGGSMGSVVGEAITRLFERAITRRVPAIVISASGGARMQEGVLSLMQMAKTSAAIARLKDEARMPYLSILTHPTTGGVAASFSMLGDLVIAEPGALIGFAGPRVIKETIGEELPEGFQTSEYLLDHGQIDLIVPRRQLRATAARLLAQLLRVSTDELVRA
jgi:acetyl-CoA carboxylase carboxyl transferase subunit beta